MISPGQRLYERYRRVEVEAEPWIYLDISSRDFWEKLATAVNSPW